MSAVQHTISPIHGEIVAERLLAEGPTLDRMLDRAVTAQRQWARAPLGQRVELARRAADALLERSEPACAELTLHMGRPACHAPAELRGSAHRARVMAGLAEEALAPIRPPERTGMTRFIQREALGVVLVLAPWNYPYLTAINTVIPALVAGNAVLIKHSDQTPTAPEHLQQALEAAGLPPGLFQVVHADHAQVGRLVADERVDFVAFTGSVAGGRAVHRAAAGKLKAVGLELGGNDPAYVRADAPIATTAAQLVDGAMYNAGQSCCAVERIYVHHSRFDELIEAMIASASELCLGDPREPETTLGPVVRARDAARIRSVVRDAMSAGARRVLDPARFPRAEEGSPYLAPELLVDVRPEMELMREETFGPVVGIVAVSGDHEALARMNDSVYGLTASIWTQDEEAALALGRQLHTGTVFMNRCDALDPELAWVGVKQSGRGCTLSRIGYEQLTRPRSFNFRTRMPGESR